LADEAERAGCQVQALSAVSDAQRIRHDAQVTADAAPVVDDPPEVVSGAFEVLAAGPQRGCLPEYGGKIFGERVHAASFPSSNIRTATDIASRRLGPCPSTRRTPPAWLRSPWSGARST